MKKTIMLFLTMMMVFTSISTYSKAQSEPFIGQIMLVPYNFAPRGWAECDGRLLPINQNQALFALIGTTYGGNGQTNFALPDLCGRVPVGINSSNNSYSLRQTGGTETITISVNQLPAHSHSVSGVTDGGNQNTPTGNLPAGSGLLDKEYSNANANTTMKAGMIGNTGSGQPVNNMQPYLTMRYVIALQGIFPSRD